MRDFINEALIRYHGLRMASAKDAALAKHHMNAMLLRIKSRSTKQIKRMEVRRGLVE
jgi:hypothetical protein